MILIHFYLFVGIPHTWGYRYLI